MSLRPFVRIDDPGDPRLSSYREMRERDLAGRRGEFVAEGVVVLEKALAAGRFGFESVLVAERKADGLAGLLAKVPEGVPVYLAGQAVMDAVVGFPIHRGVLALGRRGEGADPAALLAGLPKRALVVGLMGLSNHDNVGGVFRNAAAFGADAVLLDAGCCDPLYRKAIRVSVGAALTTPFAQAAAGRDMVRLLKAAGFEVLALSPAGDLSLAQLRRPARCAVLFGAEGPGLPAEILGQVRGVSIPMAAGFDSLNVAVTSGIVLHHLTQGSALAIGAQDPS